MGLSRTGFLVSDRDVCGDYFADTRGVPGAPGTWPEERSNRVVCFMLRNENYLPEIHNSQICCLTGPTGQVFKDWSRDAKKFGCPRESAPHPKGFDTDRPGGI